MNRKKKRICFGFAVIIWMGVIFYFSSQNGEQSSQLSDGITVQIVRIFRSDFNYLSYEEQVNLLNIFSFLVRKSAHFIEYMILGFLMTGFFNTFHWKKWIFITTTWISGTVYAISDEVHQMFLDGRTPKVMDVCIDSSGVIFGILAFLIGCVIITSIRHRGRVKEHRN